MRQMWSSAILERPSFPIKNFKKGAVEGIQSAKLHSNEFNEDTIEVVVSGGGVFEFVLTACRPTPHD